jgi:hypothetical protein
MLSSFHPQIYAKPSADPGQVFGRILSKMSLLSRQAGLAWQEVNETPGWFYCRGFGKSVSAYFSFIE